MTKKQFIHLHTHSAYSLSEGAIKLKALVALAKKNHMPALALTDTNNLFGALEFALLAAESGVQPIIGCELKLARTPAKKASTQQDKPLMDTIVLLVQSETGYKNLIKLVSHAFLDTDPLHGAHVTLKDLEQYNEGLICLSGGAQGPLNQLFLERKNADAKKLTKTLATLFKDRFYIELMRLGYPNEKAIEDFLLTLALDENYPLVATNNVYFADESMYEAHDALLCIAEGRYVTEKDRRRLSAHHYFKSSDEMAALFDDIPEAIHNTVEIAKRCAYMPKTHAPLLPAFPCEAAHSEEEELRIQAEAGLNKRLDTHVFQPNMSEDEKNTLRQQYKDRLDMELRIINQMGFPGYFLIVADFIKWAKSQKIPVGPGRGSGAGSLVAWSLTITDIDPIRFNLIFERFLNPERVSMPDFDIDFCQERRDEVISYVQERYGRDRVAQIITFGKLQARAVLRDVGRVLQIPYGQVDKICKLVPNNPANPTTLQEALDQEPELRRAQKQDHAVDKMIRIALQLEGLYRHASTHAAGVIIGDRPLNELIPLYRDPRSDMPVTQFNMKFVEKAGLVKFDFLGLKTLTILESAASEARTKGADVEISRLPLDDQKTFALLQRVETSGVFQLESAGMREVLRRLKPDRFEEIIALVALYRPGPMDDIPRYLACKHGEEEVKYMHPMLKNILRETFGVMVYQEQVMQIAQILAGYSLGGADLLRRAMGKKIKSEMDAQRKIFVEGSKTNQLTETLANQIFDQIAKFAGYGFNKSHSAPYGLIAYQTAYMKANYPVEFMAATMTYDINNTDKLNFYRQELTQMGIDLLPPNINHSYAKFTVENDAVRYALAGIKGVGAQAIDELTNEREANGKFTSLANFLHRASNKVLNKRLMESLICAGAFDSLHEDRHQLLASLDELLSIGAAAHQERHSQQVNLFGSTQTKLLEPKLRKVKPWGLLEKIQKEFETIGFFLSAHPLDAYQSYFSSLRIIPSDTLGKYAEQIIRIAGVVTDIKTRTSKKGKKFAFVTLSDMKGSFEVTVFSELLASARDTFVTGQVISALVQVRQDGENIRLIAQEVTPMNALVDNQAGAIEIFAANDLDVLALADVLSRYEGGRQTLHLILSTPTYDAIKARLPKKYALPPQAQEEIRAIHGVKQLTFDT